MKAARVFVFLAILSAPLLAQIPVGSNSTPGSKPEAQLTQQKDDGSKQKNDGTVEAPDEQIQIQQLEHAMVRLPMAAALATVLALRPRRKGTPKRQAPVVQTQIILAVVGAVVMLVVGSSLARAFGIVGAAGLVRYRAKINDPKDAGVMLSTLAIGLASGVGIWMIATFATAFILAVLWIIESFEPAAKHEFALTVKAKDPVSLKPKLEALFTRYRLDFELRTASKEELCYELKIPIEKKTDKLSNVILKLDPENATEVAWEDKHVKPNT